MPRGVERGRGWTAVPLAVLALAAAGCGSESSGDPELTVYLSAPVGGPLGQDGANVADGARTALADADGEAGGVRVELDVLDETGPRGAGDTIAAANARTATEDSTAIAYIGEIDSGTTRTSAPITNEAGVLQVSPGASAVDLTRAAPGSDEVPLEVQPSGLRTFGRVIPSDTVQGKAAAVAMRSAGDRSVGVISPPAAYTEYNRTLIIGLDSITDGPERASGPPLDALYQTSPRPERLRRAVEKSGVPADHLYGADALIAGSPPETTMPVGSVLISGAMAPSQLPGGAAAGGRSEGRFTAYGYEAMALVLDSIDRADDPLDRASVVDAFFATSDRDSILGNYSIDEVGDTTLRSVGSYEVEAGGELGPAPEPITVP